MARYVEPLNSLHLQQKSSSWQNSAESFGCDCAQNNMWQVTSGKGQKEIHALNAKPMQIKID